MEKLSNTKAELKKLLKKKSFYTEIALLSEGLDMH